VRDENETASRRVEVALALPLVDGRLLVARRAPGTHLAGSWEFPGGKIAEGEEPAAAARRELEEETGLVACELEPLVVVVHEYPDRTVRLHVFLVREPQGEVTTDAWGWKTPDELRRLETPAANAEILRALRWRLR
jgi:8-oxo-dGTP diphosphatase